MHRILVAMLVLLCGSSLVARAAQAPAKPDTSYENQIRIWHEKRVTRLTSDTGWLTVAGLFWLHPGDNSFGTDIKNDIVLPEGSAPARAGVFTHAGGKTTVRALPGTTFQVDGKSIQEMQLRSDADGDPEIVQLGNLRFFIIKRGGRYAIRMRDLNSPMRKAFRGIDSYPVRMSNRVAARFEPYDPPHRIPIANVIGTVDTMAAPGALVFTFDGKECRLDPVLESPDDKQLFILFKDATSGKETYATGRFLYADLPQDGKTTLDFNKAYNPPCAFTPYATCPLPPRQNDLPVAVRAGEKSYGHH